MKARYTSANGQLVFDIEAETAKELFGQLGSIQELFEAETKCGMCASVDIRFSARVVDEFEFFELACRGCGAQFRFGQKKKGGELFPKRKDEEGNPLPHGGWSKWQPQTSSQPMPGPREEPRAHPKTERADFSSLPTPSGLQVTFDRMAEYVRLPTAPTTLPGALAALHELFKKAAAEHIFMVKVSAYLGAPESGTPAAAKDLLRTLSSALAGINGKAA